VETTSLDLWSKFRDLSLRSDFLAVGCELATLEALRFRRRIDSQRQFPSSELISVLADEGVTELVHRENEFRGLRACIEKLSQRQRTLIQCCYCEGATMDAAAMLMGSSTSDTCRAINRVRKSLLECDQRAVPFKAASARVEGGELCALIEGQCNGGLDGKLAATLDAALLRDLAARVFFRRYFALDAALRYFGGTIASFSVGAQRHAASRLQQEPICR
jgi:DNA-directed RNA polymerase specialized sigma24 family protein